MTNILIDKIKELKKDKNFVILSHFYVNDEIQEIADFVGDSYYLSKAATNCTEKNILFCGVRFMGESAKILNPEKRVFMADMNADCPMAHMVDVEKIKEVKESYDDLAVVCYINSTALIKTYSDVCVTSANAVKIVKELKEKNIYFIPDSNLGKFIAKQVPEKNFIFNDGYCPVHAEITAEDVIKTKKAYPNALVLSHPECTEEVLSISDYIGSTSGIIKFAKEHNNKEFIICTENGIFYELKNNCPGKTFFEVKEKQICPDMKLITLEKVLDVLTNLNNEIILDNETIKAAKKPLLRMHEIAK